MLNSRIDALILQWKSKEITFLFQRWKEDKKQIVFPCSGGFNSLCAIMHELEVLMSDNKNKDRT